jgi:hypothetical protein
VGDGTGEGDGDGEGDGEGDGKGAGDNWGGRSIVEAGQHVEVSTVSELMNANWQASSLHSVSRVLQPLSASSVKHSCVGAFTRLPYAASTRPSSLDS